MAKIQTVNVGDIIIERGTGKNRMVPVRTVEHNVCSKRSVHINKSACYDWGTDVRIVEGEGTLGDVEIELGTIRVSDDGVDEDDLDKVMDQIEELAALLVKE